MVVNPPVTLTKTKLSFYKKKILGRCLFETFLDQCVLFKCAELWEHMYILNKQESRQEMLKNDN